MYKDLVGKDVEVLLVFGTGTTEGGSLVYRGTLTSVGADDKYIELNLQNAFPCAYGIANGFIVGNITKTGRIRINANYIESILQL